MKNMTVVVHRIYSNRLVNTFLRFRSGYERDIPRFTSATSIACEANPTALVCLRDGLTGFRITSLGLD